MPVGQQPLPDGAEQFDAPGARLSHRRGHCTFHTMLHEFDLTDPVPQRIARIVDEADAAQDDMPTALVRELLGPRRMRDVSAGNLAEAEEAIAAGEADIAVITAVVYAEALARRTRLWQRWTDGGR